MESIETYKVKVSEEDDVLTSDVYCISVVDSPANMSMFVTMAKEPLFKLSEVKEKRQITGVVLIPNQLIRRYNEKLNKEFNIVFGEEEIRKLAINFYKHGYQRNSNINHEQSQVIDGITFFESWQVEDPNNDKAKALGFDVPKGTWLVTGYVEDDKTWEMAKAGEVRGFSIEAFLDFEKIEMSVINNINKSKDMGLLRKMIAVFSADEEIALKTIQTDIGTLVCDSLEIGALVTKEIDGEMVPLADYAFVYEGKVYETNSQGQIKEISDYVAEVDYADQTPVEEQTLSDESPAPETPVAVAEVVNEEQPAVVSSTGDEESTEPVVEVAVEVTANAEEVPVSEAPDYKQMYENVTKQLQEVLTLKAALEAQVTELSKQPAVTKLKANEVVRGKETYMETLSRIASSNK